MEIAVNRWRGVALTVIVAISFAANSTLAALAYEGGSNALSVLVVRSTAAFVILYVILRLTADRPRLSRRQTKIGLGLGVVMAISSYGLLGAIEYMPVALCVITLYTYPLIVAISEWLSGREAFHGIFAVALLAAFIGIVFALDLHGQRPHPMGLIFAFTAAIGVAVLLIVSERVREGDDSRPFTLVMLGACMGVSVVCALLFDAFALPQTLSGWLGFIGAPLCYSFAIIFLFVALSTVGSLRASLIMNIEPVSSVLLAYALLQQSLNVSQLAGIALVVGAVVAIESIANRRAVST